MAFRSQGAPKAAIEYHLTTDIEWLVQNISFAHLDNGFLTEDRLHNAVFLLSANLNSVTGGIVIGERPTGPVGEYWKSIAPRPLQIGGLFVIPEWRRTPTAFRLGEMAAHEAARRGYTPVAFTETRSDMSRMLHRSPAVRGQQVSYRGADCTTWNLAGITGMAQAA